MPRLGERSYTIEALMAEGFSRRTIYHYTNTGILPHAIGRGRAAYYTDAHLRILRAIAGERENVRSLAEIRREHGSLIAAINARYAPRLETHDA